MHLIRRVALLCALSLSVACQDAEESDTFQPLELEQTEQLAEALTATEISVVLPREATLGEMALAGLQSVVLREGAKVTGGTVSNGPLTVKNDARVGDLLAASNISVGLRVPISGDITTGGTATLGNGSTFTGERREQVALHAEPRLRWSYTLPPATTTDITVNSGNTSTAVPGRYRTVNVHGTLQLEQGTYFFDNLTLTSGSKLLVPKDGTAPIVYVVKTVSYQGSLGDVAGGRQRPLVVYTGTATANLFSAWDTTLIAPYAQVNIASTNGTVHRGSVIAKVIDVASNAQFTARGSNALLPITTSTLQECSDNVAVDASLSTDAQFRQRMAEIARYCLGFSDTCEAEFIGKVNMDYRRASMRFIAGSGATPGLPSMTFPQYLALSRDRTHKRELITTSADMCAAARNDADNDLITDAKDRCPGTAELTATDDRGCPITTLPATPPDADIRAELAKTQLIGSAYCQDSPGPTIPEAVAFVRGPTPVAPREFAVMPVINRPEGCPLLYFLDIQVYDEAQGTMQEVVVGFQESQTFPGSNANTVGMLPQYTQAGNTDMDRARDLVNWATSSANGVMRFRAKALSGAGRQSDWSKWSNWYHGGSLH